MCLFYFSLIFLAWFLLFIFLLFVFIFGYFGYFYYYYFILLSVSLLILFLPLALGIVSFLFVLLLYFFFVCFYYLSWGWFVVCFVFLLFSPTWFLGSLFLPLMLDNTSQTFLLHLTLIITFFKVPGSHCSHELTSSPRSSPAHIAKPLCCLLFWGICKEPKLSLHLLKCENRENQPVQCLTYLD